MRDFIIFQSRDLKTWLSHLSEEMAFYAKKSKVEASIDQLLRQKPKVVSSVDDEVDESDYGEL